jgi:hypothetical protein
MKLQNFLAASLLLSSSMVSASPADFSSHGDYLTDDLSGLDWYNVSATNGWSYDAIQRQLGVGGGLEGWRYASANEVNTMLQDYSGLTLNPSSATLNDGIFRPLIISLGYTDTLALSESNNYVQIFGITSDAVSPCKHSLRRFK